MQIYQQELDCLNSLVRKLTDALEVCEREHNTTTSDGYKAFLANGMVSQRDAIKRIEKAIKSINRIND